MTTLEQNSKNNDSLINQGSKKEENSSIIKYKNENNTLRSNSKYKKLVLPQIQKERNSYIHGKSFNRKIKSSQSQNDIFNNKNNKSIFNKNNTAKEQLMIAKQKLTRLISRINDINCSYRKLLYEKEENLNILRQAISSNDYTYSENL